MFCLGFHVLAHQALCFAVEFDEPLVEGSQMNLCGLPSIPQRHSRGELRMSCWHLQKMCLVGEFTWDGASTYVGRTSQSLAKRISQHLPNRLFERATRSRKSTADSAKTRHVREHPECLITDPKSRFKVSASACDSWHLEVLEALFIKARNLSLCAQKEHVRVLKLF